ncbi:hypothetical protein, partial [Stenotrophomonas maltophilia]|uniref:hypothetical protein n=1 Tax=Stenotrophomonas maltophilia TaxID=40324 RepID=UPI003BF7FC15
KHFPKRKNGKKESSDRVQPQVRRAISPGGCKRSAALCARSNEGGTILAAFLSVSVGKCQAGWLLFQPMRA